MQELSVRASLVSGAGRPCLPLAPHWDSQTGTLSEGRPAKQGGHRPLGSAAAIVSSIPAMAADLRMNVPAAQPGPHPQRPPDNVKMPVKARQWAEAAKQALDEAWSIATDDPHRVAGESSLVHTVAHKRYLAEQERFGLGEERIYCYDSRSMLLRHSDMNWESRRAASRRLSARGLRDPPVPLVPNHHYRFSPGETEKNHGFNYCIPLTLVYEYKVPKGMPNEGRLMPIWIGDWDVATKGSTVLTDHHITAVMCFARQPWQMAKGNGRDFKTLVSDFNPYCDFEHTRTEAEVLQESRKLLKAWRGGGPRGGGVGEVWGGGRGPMRVTMPTHREALAMIVYHLARGEGGVLLYGGFCTRSVAAMAACLLMLLSKGSLRFEECYELCIALRPACARYKVSEAATLMSPIFEHWDTVTATPSGKQLAGLLRDCHVPALVLPQTFVDGVQDGEKWDQELTPLQHGVVPLTEEQDCEKVPRIAWAQLFPMDYPMNYTAWERLYERQGRPRTIWLDMMNVAAQEEDQPPAAQRQPPPASGCTRSSTQQQQQQQQQQPASSIRTAATPQQQQEPRTSAPGGGGGGAILPWSGPRPEVPPQQGGGPL